MSFDIKVNCRHIYHRKYTRGLISELLFEKGIYMHIQHGPGSLDIKSSQWANEGGKKSS